MSSFAAAEGDKAHGDASSTAASVLDENQKSFAKQLADFEKKDSRHIGTSTAAKQDTVSSDSKRVAKAYAAYAAFGPDASVTKTAA